MSLSPTYPLHLHRSRFPIIDHDIRIDSVRSFFLLRKQLGSVLNRCNMLEIETLTRGLHIEMLPAAQLAFLDPDVSMSGE